MHRILALAIVLAAAQLADAAEFSRDSFLKSIQSRIAPAAGSILKGKWKALCLCNTSGKVGAIESDVGGADINVFCSVPVFLADGTSIGAALACYDFTPIAK